MADPANHIGDLNPTLPLEGGPVGEGDDEIRTVKRALTNDFPAITNTVYQDADTSGAGGTTPVTNTTMSSWEARIAKNETDIGGLQAQGVFVIGMIVLWSGSLGTIPSGWALCDGSIANSTQTPDLRDRFVMGAGATYSPDDTGGNTTPTTSTAGNHNHSITVNQHTLTASQIPSHTHGMFTNEQVPGSIGTPPGTNQKVAYDGNFGSNKNYEMQGGTLNTADRGRTGETGANQGHTHNASSANDGDHSHVVQDLNPFYALAYIIFVGS